MQETFNLEMVPPGLRSRIPPGKHRANFVLLVDIGTHEIRFRDYHSDFKRQILVGFELPDYLRYGADVPHIIQAVYNYSTDTRSKLINVFKDVLYTFHPGNWNLQRLLGISLDVITTNNDKGYPRLEALQLSRDRDGKFPRYPSYVKPFCWHFERDGEPEIPAWVPNLYGAPLIAKIHSSREYQRLIREQQREEEEGNNG